MMKFVEEMHLHVLCIGCCNEPASVSVAAHLCVCLKSTFSSVIAAAVVPGGRILQWVGAATSGAVFDLGDQLLHGYLKWSSGRLFAIVIVGPI